jgi:hypothetical protein
MLTHLLSIIAVALSIRFVLLHRAASNANGLQMTISTPAHGSQILICSAYQQV